MNENFEEVNLQPFNFCNAHTYTLFKKKIQLFDFYNLRNRIYNFIAIV